MHPNPAFRTADTARNIAFARHQGFGMLAVATDDAPLVTHVPFLLSEDGIRAEFHLVRSNPSARLLATRRARVAVQGPHGYVSPDWYGVADPVPARSYVAVHLVGEITLQPQDRMRDLLDRQSAQYEARLAPEPEWRAEKMTPDALERIMRQIVPCAMRVDEIVGTWKPSRNRPAEVRLRTAGPLEDAGEGQEVAARARLVRKPPD